MTQLGTNGDDTIYGTSGDDVIAGLGGDDIIYGSDGDDIICGGDGDDSLDGESGYDQTWGGAGSDWCDGEVNSSCEDGPQAGIRVPDVGGLCATPAMDELTSVGLNIDPHDNQGSLCGDHSSTCWEVVGQSPSAGSYVPDGTGVTLSIAWFNACGIEMPDVIRYCYEDADSWLTSLGLIPEEFQMGYQCPDGGSESSCWDVDYQFPAAGETVNAGDEVSLETVWYATSACSP